jgi:hypothetical protein
MKTKRIVFGMAMLIYGGCASINKDVPRIAFTKRHLSSEFVYRGADITVSKRPSEILVQKKGGPGTIEFLLDYPLVSDFKANLIVELATLDELGVEFGRSDPVPFFGVRSADGANEFNFNLSTDPPPGKRYHILLRRAEGSISAFVDDSPAEWPVGPQSMAEPVYVRFVMNDVSRVRVHYLRIEEPPGTVVTEYGRTNNVNTDSAHP